MRAVWQLAISSISNRRGRTALLVLAVALATALSIAVSGVMHMAGQSVILQSGTMAGLADTTIRHSFGERILTTTLDEVRHHPDVKAATGKLNVGATVRLERTDKKTTLVLQGIEPQHAPILGPLRFLAGRNLESDNEVIIDQKIHQQLEAEIDDTITVVSAKKKVELTIVGVYERPPLAVLQKPMAKLMLKSAQSIGGLPGMVDIIDIKLKKGVVPENFEKSNAGALPAGVKYQTTAATSAKMNQGVENSNLIVQLVTGIVFSAAAFIILTSLTTAVTQRMRELAVLRCIGASRSQIFYSTLLAGVIVCGAGALLGLPIGAAVCYVMYLRFDEIITSGFALSPFGMAAAMLAAITAGLFGAVYPAIVASRIKPLAALAVRAKKPSIAGIVTCVVVGLASAGWPLYLVSADIELETIFWVYIYIGLPFTFGGYFLLSVLVLIILANTLAPLVAKAMRLPPNLLRQTLLATPYRHGMTGGALMVSLAMLVTIWTDGRSILNGWFDQINMPDGFVHSFFAMTPAQINRLKQVDAITAICPSKMFPVETANVKLGVDELITSKTQFVSADIEVFLSMTDLTWVQGDPDSALEMFRKGPSVLVSREFLIAHDVKVGDKLALKTNDGPVEFDVAGIVFSPGLDIAVHYFGIQTYYADASISSVFGTREDAKKFFNVDTANLVLLKLRDDVSDKDALKEIRTKVPGVVAGSSRVIKRHVHKMASGFMTLASGIAVAALVIACFGLGNLIIANITARRFEYGVLRAIGSDRRMVGRLVFAEAIIVAVTGCVIGAVLGTQLSLAAAYIRNRIFGLGYTPQFPWDVAFMGATAVVIAALIAATPPVLRLMRAHPRVLLASEQG